MTFEKLLNDLSFNKISPKDAYNEINDKSKMKKINYYSHLNDIENAEPLKDTQLQELNAIVNVLQILDNSSEGSPISDSEYDNMQELLVSMGIPRLTGTVEINSASKVNHKYTQLRGTLDKVYYLTLDEKRTNKSRKYLDDWIKSAEALYESRTGKKINLNSVKIMCQPKFDGTSTILEVDEMLKWITRGDTLNNIASDVSHIMNIFNDKYKNESIGTGIKFEVMVSEEDKDKINELYRNNDNKYRNSRQIATAAVNSKEPDFKCDYLRPIPLRIIHEGDKVEQISQDLIKNFPTMICTFGDREKIREFANNHRYIKIDGVRLRTDGLVMTILDDDIKIVLGRDNNINNFEVAYKFTEEVAYSKVKDVEFYVSEFSFITPVLVINDVIMKGNTISRISLSNKERFDELNLSYGDTVKILYDIIPYATLDDKCERVKNGRKIEFISECPKCGGKLDLDKVQVQCTNPSCPSRIIGRMLNYCSNLRIQNIGYSTLDTLYSVGLLNDGIQSLYKLRKKKPEIELLEGFGKTKTNKIVSEIEAKRKLKDYELFGSIGIEGLSIKTFKEIFLSIKLSDFLNMIKLKNFSLMKSKLMSIHGIGPSKSNQLVKYVEDNKNRKELQSILKEVKLIQTFGSDKLTNGRVVFTGCRPTDEVVSALANFGYEATGDWANSAKCLVIPKEGYESAKVNDAIELQIPIITKNELFNMLGIS